MIIVFRRFIMVMAILFATKNTLTAQNDLNHSVYLELGVVQGFIHLIMI